MPQDHFLYLYSMRNLSHLPEQKQKEVLEILSIIMEEANPEKVILFGSHAGEKWVEDEYIEDGIRFSYNSDYDFLVVIDKRDSSEKEYAIISHIENRTNHIKNPVNVIVHDIEYINQGLRFSQYFFTDIVRYGVLLSDKRTYQFAEPVILTPQEEKEKARRYFDIWYPQGSEFLVDSENAYNRGSLRNGAFYLHQAAESFYSTALLVYTGYKPKTHNLQKLRTYSKHISSELYLIFTNPVEGEMEYRLFDLLKKGYVDARYKPDYNITKDELYLLIQRVTLMKKVVEEICQKKISAFK
ncbi:HEPN domain-containing protein [Arcticibacter tournemirensis]|uniref:HEPN domain-containing protein n=1 Tax=Arcticibacter tournemirensis TaxID=699437 RepID=A0A4Q0M4A8_9SPHI|nr:HEPN domain-containing protein [Arcticibacter tournemirensis]RXF67724.1 HEPN domain-containing protein [Arcticibacter tournemirensis]